MLKGFIMNYTVTVIGVGLIGGSLCHAFKKEGLNTIGVSSQDTIKKAEDLKIIDRGYSYDGIGEAVKEADFVFICTPLLEIGRILPLVIENSKKNCIISDVGSTKSTICGLAERNKKRGVYFVGGHPMAGSEKRGIDNANPYLFYDAVWVITPLKGTPKRVVKSISNLISMVGAKIMILTPELHDKIAANISHLPQFLAVLLTNQLADKNNDLYRNLAAGGFRDMTRIASSDFSIWKGIIETNRDEIFSAMEEYKRRLEKMINSMHDLEFIKSEFEKAAEERKTIPRYSKGFLKPLVDVRVTVRDKPGELAKITNIIYYQGVNIKDIEIINIREGEGGILRLGFSEKREANTAAQALSKFGYDVIIV